MKLELEGHEVAAIIGMMAKIMASYPSYNPECEKISDLIAKVSKQYNLQGGMVGLKLEELK